MTRRTRTTTTAPVDGMWRFDFDEAALARFGDEYKAWIETSEVLQRQATEYFTSRMAKDAAMMERLATCKSMAQLFELQADYTREAFGDILENGRRVSAKVEETVRRHAP